MFRGCSIEMESFPKSNRVAPESVTDVPSEVSHSAYNNRNYNTVYHGASHLEQPLQPQHFMQPAGRSQQNSQQVIMVGDVNQTSFPAVVQSANPKSFPGPIILACIAFWFFGGLFGLIAFIIASESLDS